MLRVLHLALVITATATVGTEGPNSGGAFNNNEWTPVSRENVFGGLNRESVPRNSYAEAFNRNLNDLAVNGNIYNNEEDLLSKSSYVGYKRTWNSKRSFLENIKSETDYNEEKNCRDATTTLPDNADRRKAKVMSTRYYVSDINNLAAANMLKETHKFNRATEKDDHTTLNRYEVTESNEMELAGEENNFIGVKNTSLGFSESKKVFKINAESDNGLIKKFLSILSNYNIRVNDDLPNYGLSRSSERSPAKQEYILIPVPIRLLGRNKLAADPLLALRLSNYGYNLRGRVGVVRAGRRASASSDFYNNQFPGLYRTYSDTDSSQ